MSRFMSALAEVQKRGAEEACLMVLDGEPGVSKTATVSWWATQTGSIYIRAKAEWTAAWMMRELLGSLNVVPAHSFERMYGQALQALGARARQAERSDEIFAVIVDEVDHIVRSAKLLETLRDLSDMLEIPFILVGMGRIRTGLTRYPQIASRISKPVEFQRASLEDVRAMVKGLCECEVKDDLIAFLHKA
ncbi:AAA family ATPase, partial [Telmatospirillum sp. J64-1]|uniref:AAA family ATPase n=1 Tax=Telmatospirillum sp. J64-1 TaxID=2502183 RepID=UPI00115E9033